jgi:hypothetical protein
MAWFYPWLFFFQSVVLVIFAAVLWAFAIEIRNLKKRLNGTSFPLLTGEEISDYGPHLQGVPADLLQRLKQLERRGDVGVALPRRSAR